MRCKLFRSYKTCKKIRDSNSILKSNLKFSTQP